MKKLILFLITCTASAQTPTLLSYLHDRMTNLYGGISSAGVSIQGIYPQLIGNPFPAPIPAGQAQFIYNTTCGYQQVTPSTPVLANPCVFTVAQAEAQADSMCLMAKPLKYTFQFNMSWFIWIDNTTNSQNARTFVQTIIGYIINTSTACNGASIALNLTPLGEDLTKAYTSQAKTTTTCNVSAFSNVSGLTSCVEATGLSWLGGDTFLAYAVGGLGVSNYTPSRIVLVHEPTSTNSIYGWDGVTTGTPTNWALYVSTLGAAVYAITTTMPIGVALGEADATANYTAPLITASGGHVTVAGFDIYNDLFATGGDLGRIYTNGIVVAKANGINYPNLFMSEMWMDSWAPTGQSTDANAYEGVGNCTWINEDMIRQEITGMALWAAWAGISEIDWFNVDWTSTACIYGLPNNGNDKTTSAIYEALIASRSIGPYPANNPPTYQTKTWFFLQKLYAWVGVVQSGVGMPW